MSAAQLSGRSTACVNLAHCQRLSSVRHIGTTRVSCRLPARCQPGRRPLKCRAEEPPWVRQEDASPGDTSNKPSGESQKEEDAKVAKGQRTAVITGFVSVAFGVIYLALTAFLDSRGSQLLPPPPEAFGQ